MSQPFECFCGSNKCLQQITGASDMQPEMIARYLFTDFIEGKLKTAGKK
jgi:hypothetical protein